MINIESHEGPSIIGEYELKCPRCGSIVIARDYIYDIPYYDRVLITIIECGNCGYRYRDVVVLKESYPKRIIYRVEEPGDENALVLKSSICKIEIPELGLTLESGIYSQGYITTVEGLIHDFIDVLRDLCNRGEVSVGKCIETRLTLEKAINMEIKYTVIIHDYLGTCDIVGNKKPIYEELK